MYLISVGLDLRLGQSLDWFTSFHLQYYVSKGGTLLEKEKR